MSLSVTFSDLKGWTRGPSSYDGSSHVCSSGLLILQYNIAILSIANTIFSIAKVLQYFLKICIGIDIGNTFFQAVLVLILPILFKSIVNNPDALTV